MFSLIAGLTAAALTTTGILEIAFTSATAVGTALESIYFIKKDKEKDEDK